MKKKLLGFLYSKISEMFDRSISLKHFWRVCMLLPMQFFRLIEFWQNYCFISPKILTANQHLFWDGKKFHDSVDFWYMEYAFRTCFPFSYQRIFFCNVHRLFGGGNWLIDLNKYFLYWNFDEKSRFAVFFQEWNEWKNMQVNFSSHNFRVERNFFTHM